MPPAAAPGRGEDVASASVAIVLMSFAAVTPLIPMLARIEPYHALVAVLHALACAVGAGLAIHRRFRPCLLIASVFPYCWLVLPSVYQIQHQLAAWNDPGVTTDFSATLRAQLVLALGQICLLIGYAVVSQRPSRPRAVWVIDSARRRLMTWLSTAYLLGAILLTPILVAALGGPGALFSSRTDVLETASANGLASDQQVVGSLVKVAPSSLAIAAGVLALWLLATSTRGSRDRWVSLLLAGACFVLLLVVANPIVSSRFLVLATFGTFALAMSRPRRRLGALVWFVLSVCALLLAYPAASYFRYGETTSGPDPILASNDFDGFQQMINTVTLVDSQGFDWGLHLMSAIFFFVPRGLWADKAQPSTFDIAQARGYDFQDLSTPFPAEAYLGFGWVGVVVLLLLLGAAWGYLDRHWLAQTRIAVIAAYVAVAQVGLWRGPFGSLSGVFGFTVGLLVIAVFATGRWNPFSRGPDVDPARRLSRRADLSDLA